MILDPEDPAKPKLRGIVRLLAIIANTLGPIGMSIFTLGVIVAAVVYFRNTIRNALATTEFTRAYSTVQVQ